LALGTQERMNRKLFLLCVAYILVGKDSSEQVKFVRW
jgi:hypothetical protein